jgi:hypothetical protein
MTVSTGFPFRRLLRLAGITVEVFLPAATRGAGYELRTPAKWITCLNQGIYKWRHWEGRQVKAEGNVMPVTGCGDPQCCETSRIIHFLENRLIDGGEVVSLWRRLLFTPRETP